MTYPPNPPLLSLVVLISSALKHSIHPHTDTDVLVSEDRNGGN